MDYRDVYAIEIGNTVNSLIWTTKAQYQLCALRDVYAIKIRNTVNPLIRTTKGQYQVCLQRCLCYRDSKYYIKCAHYGDVYAIEIVNTVNSLI